MPQRLSISFRRSIALFAAICAFAGSALARDPTNEEQLMVEMVNRMRADPAGELPRLVNITTSGGVPVFANPSSPDLYVRNALSSFAVSASALTNQWNLLAPAPPVAWNGFLGVSSQTYSNVMLAADAQAHNLDSHKNAQGQADIIGRLEASGYQFEGGGFGGESIFAFAQNIFHGHAGFAIDWGNGPNGIQNPPGHRNLIMNSQMKEIGIGIITDPSNTNSVGPKLITQHFAGDTATGPFLTGVVYDENGADNFYTPGEGLGGVTIIATATSGQRFSTTTFGSGGYTLELLPNRTYSIVASGPGLGQISLGDFTVGSNNVKRDFVTLAPPLIGDANMDGAVNRADAALLAANMGQTSLALWGDGDFDFDGRITLADLALLQRNMSAAGSPVAIPEPSAATLAAGLVGLAMLSSRRRSWRGKPRGV